MIKSTITCDRCLREESKVLGNPADDQRATFFHSWTAFYTSFPKESVRFNLCDLCIDAVAAFIEQGIPE